MQITIVLPIYNEIENLPKLVPALLALPLPGLKLLVIDDNSPDGSGKLADELAANHPGRIRVHHRQGKLGLGSAYITGYRLAIEDGAEAICQMDSDFSHPPEKVLELAKMLQTCDAALGSRYIPGGAVDVHWPAWRKALSRFGGLYATAILRLPVSDSTGGFRMWRRETLQGMPLDKVRANGYVFQIEMAYLAYKLGYKFGEVPFYFADRKWGESKMSFRIQLEAAFRVWKLLWDHRSIKRVKR